MKTNILSIGFLIGALLLSSGCTTHPLADKVFSTPNEEQTFVIKFLDNGKAVSANYYTEDTNPKDTYLWECSIVDTFSYHIKDHQVYLTQNGNLIGHAPIDEQELTFQFSEDQGVDKLTLKKSDNFKALQKKGKYAGSSYTCTTLSDKPIELRFISDDLVVYRKGKGNDEICSYQATEDGYVSIENKFELEQEKGHLKGQNIGTNYLFHKTKYKPSEFDAVEATLVTEERKREDKRRMWELIRKSQEYERRRQSL